MALFVLISVLLASYMCYVDGQSSCTTPSGAGGSCISLYDCSELVTIVTNPNKSRQDIQLLKKSHCGYDGSVPRVCCPAQTQDDTCFTPDRQQGRCVGLYSCQHLADRLKPPVPKETVDFMKKSRCNGPEQYSVCCGPPPAPTPAFPTSKGCKLTAALPDPSSRCCGVDVGLGDKIVGGTATSVDQYPWLVLLEYVRNNRVSLSCGGALISGRYVLTAGHCVKGKGLESRIPKNVRLGEYNTGNEGSDCAETAGGGLDCTTGIIVIPIEKVIPHPEYNPNGLKHDIALLRLTQLAVYTEFIRPICLPLTDIAIAPAPNLTLYAAGWGADESTNLSKIKLHVDLPFVSQTKCQPAFNVAPRKTVLWKGQLCAGGEAGKDSCSGDSGGPLMHEHKNRYFEIVGVVSFGSKSCGTENVPGVYTKVSEYIPWIKSQIRP